MKIIAYGVRKDELPFFEKFADQFGIEYATTAKELNNETAKLAKGFDVTQLAFAFVGFLIFSIFGTIAALKTNKVVFAIMFLICFLFFGLATDLFLGGRTWFFSLAAWSELFISLLGFYGSGAVLVNKVFGKTVFPLGSALL